MQPVKLASYISAISGESDYPKHFVSIINKLTETCNLLVYLCYYYYYNTAVRRHKMLQDSLWCLQHHATGPCSEPHQSIESYSCKICVSRPIITPPTPSYSPSGFLQNSFNLFVSLPCLQYNPPISFSLISLLQPYLARSINHEIPLLLFSIVFYSFFVGLSIFLSTVLTETSGYVLPFVLDNKFNNQIKQHDKIWCHDSHRYSLASHRVCPGSVPAKVLVGIMVDKVTQR